MNAPHALTLAIDALVVAGFVYLALLGVRLIRNSDHGGMSSGIGLLGSAAFGLLVWAGIEVEIPLSLGAETVNAEGERVPLLVPLLLTLTEVGSVIAIAGFLVELITISRKARGRDELLHFQRTALFLGLVLVGVLAIYEIHFAEKLPIRTAILSIGGALVFIVGLALQSTLGNVFAGYELQADRVFRKGDHVQLGRDGVIGRVVDSTLRTTSIHTHDGEMLTIRNHDLLGKDFRNLDRPTPILRQLVQFGVAYDVPPAVVKDVALQVLAHDRCVLRIPEPQVALLNFADSCVTYEMRFWIPDFEVRDETLDRVRTRLWYALRDAGIDIPYPMRTIRMASADEERARVERATERSARTAQVLQGCALFDDRVVNSGERRELARDAGAVKLEAGEVVIRRGEHSDAMFIVETGSCEVMLPDAARVTLGPGAHFGEIALLRREPRSADVVAGPGGASLLRLPRASVLPILSRHPELRNRLGDIARQRLETQGGSRMAAAAPVNTSFAGGVLRLLRPW